MFLAAGLAAALVLVGAGFPSMIYQLVNSTLTFEQSPDSTSVTYEHNVSSIEAEDGRLFFVLDGERTDITDLINEDTPYIYDGSDPETGLTYYLIMGGTPENYGSGTVAAQIQCDIGEAQGLERLGDFLPLLYQMGELLGQDLNAGNHAVDADPHLMEPQIQQQLLRPVHHAQLLLADGLAVDEPGGRAGEGLFVPGGQEPADRLSGARIFVQSIHIRILRYICEF